MRARLLGTVVVVALISVGCTRDEDAATTTTALPTTPSTTATPTTPPTTAAPVATTPATALPATSPPALTTPLNDDAALAASALLTLADFAEGWTEDPYDPASDSDDAETVRFMAECAGLDASLIGTGVMGDSKAKSGTFISPDPAFSVIHTVGLAPDEATAAAASAAIGDPALPDCYEQAVVEAFETAKTSTDPATSLPEGLELVSVTMEPVDLTGSAVGDDTVWLSVVVEFDFEGDSYLQYIDLVFLRDGRALSQLELGGDNAPFPDDLIDPIVSLAVDRLEAIA